MDETKYLCFLKPFRQFELCKLFILCNASRHFVNKWWLYWRFCFLYSSMESKHLRINRLIYNACIFFFFLHSTFSRFAFSLFLLHGSIFFSPSELKVYYTEEVSSMWLQPDKHSKDLPLFVWLEKQSRWRWLFVFLMHMVVWGKAVRFTFQSPCHFFL